MRKKEKQFGAKLYSMFMKSLLIPVVIAMTCFFGYFAQTMSGREESHARNVLKSVSQNVELQITELENIKKAFYIHSEIFQEAEFLNNPDLYAHYNELSRIDIERSYVITLTKMLHTSAQKIRCAVFYPASEGDTAYYLGKDSARLQEISCPGYHQEEWYQQILEEPGRVVYLEPHIPEYMVNKRLGQVYSYISAARSVDSQKIIGIIKIDVDIGQLQETMDTVKLSSDSGLLLLYNGKILLKSSHLADELEMLENGKVRVNSKTCTMKYKTIGDDGLEVAYVSYPVGIYLGYACIIGFSVLILIAGSVLAFSNYRHQARAMVQDVAQITEVIQLVERGNLDTFIHIRDDSEFGKIAGVINQMIRHLKEYIDKEYVLVIQQQRAEYRALQSQINPHFLYNTLNGFIALNRMGEQKVLEQSIVGLSKLFRYACSPQDTSAVQEEFDFLEEYLKLEKLKHDDRLAYMIWMDEECSQMRIPKLLLQPIVENSIKHGMGNTDQPIMIRISAVSTLVKGIGRVMILTVRDNGVGFECPRDLDGKTHVGIENVRMRAELYCKNMIYQCESRAGMGTKTTFVFPEET